MDQINRLVDEKERKQIKMNVLVQPPPSHVEGQVASKDHPAREALEAKRAKELAEGRRQLTALQQKIDQLSQPFPATLKKIRDFVVDVRNVLDYIPVDSPRLNDIRREIQRLPMFAGSRPSDVSIRDSYTDLPKLKHRLGEILKSSSELRDTNGESKRSSSLTGLKRSPADLIGGWLTARRQSTARARR